MSHEDRVGLFTAGPLALALVACGTAPEPTSSQKPPAEIQVVETALADIGPYRYVLLAESQTSPAEPVGFARLIVDTGHDCTKISVTGGPDPLPMSPRANLHGFQVDVCEAAIPSALFGTALAITSGDESLSLPLIKTDPTAIIAMGDTGCYSGTGAGNCPPGTPATPFQSLARSAAASQWDLLLHMGDYNYRGTPGGFYDAGDGKKESDNCDQSPSSGFKSMNISGTPDDWTNWEDDFFEPAGDLLWAAPWIFTRGNHELCSRAGPGWFYFLDPSSILAAGGGSQSSCPGGLTSDNPFDWVQLPDPYLVALGSLNVAVLDSANACDSFATPAMKQFTDSYDQQLASIAAKLQGQGNTWIMSHRPIWGVDPYDGDKSTPCTSANAFACLNQTLQHAVKAIGGLPSNISLSLAGHMHKFQTLTFTAPPGDAARPPQIIVGDGGVALDTRPPCDDFSSTITGYATTGRATGGSMSTPQGAVSGFGFLEIEYTAANESWNGTLEDPATRTPIATCGTTEQAAGSVCEFKDDVSFQGCTAL